MWYAQHAQNVEEHRKVLVPEDDNLYKDKHLYVEDNVQLPDLKVGNVYTKLDCKPLKKNCKVWTGKRQAGSTAEHLVGGMHGKDKRKGVQFATMFHILYHGRPMCVCERT